jgi:hypothetical protein
MRFLRSLRISLRALYGLFPGGGAIGRSLRVGAASFEVIGQLRPKGVGADGSDADSQILDQSALNDPTTSYCGEKRLSTGRWSETSWT